LLIIIWFLYNFVNVKLIAISSLVFFVYYTFSHNIIPQTPKKETPIDQFMKLNTKNSKKSEFYNIYKKFQKLLLNKITTLSDIIDCRKNLYTVLDSFEFNIFKIDHVHLIRNIKESIELQIVQFMKSKNIDPRQVITEPYNL
jgi:hypothetical protein